MIPTNASVASATIRTWLTPSKNSKTTIAAVDGYAVGGGLEITMAVDFVIATERARFGMPEVDWGITPGWGGTTRMARLIDRRRTKEINLLGAIHPAGVTRLQPGAGRP